MATVKQAVVLAVFDDDLATWKGRFWISHSRALYEIVNGSDSGATNGVTLSW